MHLHFKEKLLIPQLARESGMTLLPEEKVLELYKMLGKSLESSLPEIYSIGSTYIASFAPTVFEAYKHGDSTALKIIERNAYEASKIINGARRQSTDVNDKIVICGGLCKQKDILEPFLMKYIENITSLHFLDKPMVNGAISLAGRIKNVKN